MTPSRPVIVSAATSALTMASSVASMTASKSASRSGRRRPARRRSARRPDRRRCPSRAGAGCRSRTRGTGRRSCARRRRPPGDAQAGPLGQPLALVGQQRRVGGHDDDDRARARRRRRGRRRRSAWPYGLGTSLVGIASPTGTPSIAQPVAPAVVGLDQHADRVAAASAVDDPRRRPDAALELVADHARPAADVALGDRPAGAPPRGRRSTCSAATWKPLMSLSRPSYVSPTTGRRPVGRRAGRGATGAATSASRTTPTLWVLVIAMGVVEQARSRGPTRGRSARRCR